jgi:hypothetical protein
MQVSSYIFCRCSVSFERQEKNIIRILWPKAMLTTKMECTNTSIWHADEMDA